MAELVFMPKQAAAELGVSGAALRRAAAGYEVTFGGLERDARGGRLFTGEALDRLRLALEAVHAGRVSSVETALKLIHDDGAFPQVRPLTPRAGERTDLEAVPADLLAALHVAQAHNVELHLEISTLRQDLSSLTTTMQGMAADQQDIKQQLEALAGHAATDRKTTNGLPLAVRDAMNEALGPGRLRVALHGALPEPGREPRRPSWLQWLVQRFKT